MKFFIPLYVLCLVGAALIIDSRLQTAKAELSLESLTAHLTGGDQRTWIKHPWKQHLADNDPRCISGEMWVFIQGGTGKKRICEDGTAREQEFRWSWEGVDNGEAVILVDGQRYVVELRQRKPKMIVDPPILITILRTIRSGHIDPINETILEFQDL